MVKSPKRTLGNLLEAKRLASIFVSHVKEVHLDNHEWCQRCRAVMRGLYYELGLLIDDKEK